ncbi:hypothetical protein D3C87_1366210 [compost metagenome]
MDSLELSLFINSSNTTAVLFKSSVPVLSSKRTSKPAALPKPGTVGGGKNSIWASAICAVFSLSSFITSSTVCERSSQDFKLIIPIPYDDPDTSVKML